MKDREWRKKVQRKRFLRNSNLILYGRLAVFLLLVGLQVFILLVTDMPMFWGVLAVECVLVLENIVKMFVLKKFSHKIACYVIDFIGLLTLTLLTRTSLVSTLCMVILSEFYLSTRSFGANVAMAAVWEVFYLAIRVTTAFVWENEIDNETITGTANDMLIIVIHFVILVEERLPAIKIGKLLLNPHDVPKVLGKVGRDSARHRHSARNASEKRDCGAFLGFVVDHFKRQRVDIGRRHSCLKRSCLNGKIGINLGAVLLELGSQEHAAVNLHARETRRPRHDFTDELFHFFVSR